MRQKPLIGLLVIIVIAVVFWMVGGAVGSSVMGGDEFEVWRERNFWAYLGIFAAAVVVAALPVLWFLGRRLEKVFKEQEESAAATKGVGRLTMKAVAGDVSATDHLFDLLENNPVAAIRYQAARGLAMIGRPQVDKELFRQVRYWHADDKMALITTLKRGNDMRMYGLMRLLAEDRNPQVARRAQAALVHIMPKTARMDDYAEKIARPRDAKRAEAARKAAAARGESADAYPEIATAPSLPPSGEEPETRTADAASGQARRSVASVDGETGAAAPADSMSPAARAARKVERTAEEPRRRRKKQRAGGDVPPVRPLSTDKIGAEPSPGPTAAESRPAPGGKGRPSAAAKRPPDDAGRRSAGGKRPPDGEGEGPEQPRRRPADADGKRVAPSPVEDGPPETTADH